MRTILILILMAGFCYAERPLDEQVQPPKPPVPWIGPLEEGEPEIRRLSPAPWLIKRTTEEKVQGMKRGNLRDKFKKRPNPKGIKPRESMFNRA